MAVKARRQAVVVDVGGVKVGWKSPDCGSVDDQHRHRGCAASTVNQVMALAQAGSELVRVTVNTEQAAAAVAEVVDTLR